MNTLTTGTQVIYRGREYTLTGRSDHGGYFLERNGHTMHAAPSSKVTPVEVAR